MSRFVVKPRQIQKSAYNRTVERRKLLTKKNRKINKKKTQMSVSAGIVLKIPYLVSRAGSSYIIHIHECSKLIKNSLSLHVGKTLC